jgi:hypothetical protein
MTAPEISTPCAYCAAQATANKGTMWAARGLDWPMTEVDGRPVHKACEHDMAHAVESFGQARPEGDALVWDTNGHAPFDDMLATWVALGLATPEQRTATNTLRATQTAASIESYRRAQANISAEQRAEQIAEMRAAFGPGEVVVDVLTGERIQL